MCFADVRFPEETLAGDDGGNAQLVMEWLMKQPCSFHVPDLRLADTSNPWDARPGQRIYLDCEG